MLAREDLAVAVSRGPSSVSLGCASLVGVSTDVAVCVCARDVDAADASGGLAGIGGGALWSLAVAVD
jgi:hypothetical protein